MPLFKETTSQPLRGLFFATTVLASILAAFSGQLELHFDDGLLLITP
jgi:hypothetical protein